MSKNHRRQIYFLSPRQLTPETIAVAFAKTSRSPHSFSEIARELNEEKSAKFHEKWVLGYGHASVAEHAVLHIAFENVSRLAIESIESNRLASYTEKSTRYQKWNPDSFYLPNEVVGTPYEEIYNRICRNLFSTYQEILKPTRAVIQKRFPRCKGESNEQWDRRIRSGYVDSCRFLLPSASLANVGMTANARVLERAISKMLAHPLAEVRQIGVELRETAIQEVPTLLKYADATPYLPETKASLARRAAEIRSGNNNRDMLRLIEYDPEGENRILAAALYANCTGSYDDIFAYVSALTPGARKEIAAAMMGRLGRFDVPLRELEHATYTFDALMDQGAYFEVKRHRMMTQTPQRLTANLRYAIPSLIVEAGAEDAYKAAMDSAAEVYHKMEAWNPDTAAYVVANGFNRRLLFTLNLRDLYHFCELRSAPNAHFSVRRIALRMVELVREVHPILTEFLRLPEEADWRLIEEENLSQT